MIPETTINQLLSHILPSIQTHTSQQPRKPFILALTGLQGSGKTTWTTSLTQTLNTKHNLRTINISLDDLYLTHDDLVRVREENVDNALLQMRGQPGTHDTCLAREFFDSLERTVEGGEDVSREILIPEFDKSLFCGEGDRVDKGEWRRVEVSGDEGVDVLILEGWCVGFQALDEEAIERKWEAAKQQQMVLEGDESRFSTRTLQNHPLASYIQINRNLQKYCDTFMGPQHLDFLVHLDTDDLVNVYKWRLEQEHALHKKRGQGMSDDEVVAFVRGYMPAYELYLDTLRTGIFKSLSVDEKAQKGQCRVVLDKDRKVVDMVCK